MDGVSERPGAYASLSLDDEESLVARATGGDEVASEILVGEKNRKVGQMESKLKYRGVFNSL